MSAAELSGRAIRAGDRLSDTIAWGKRPEIPRPTALTRRDLRLMALLYDMNYLSASQLTLLGWGRDSDAAGKRLRRLHDSGHLDKFRPPAARGSREWNYRLATRGWQALKQHELTAETRYSPPELHSISYAEHDLQLNALIIHIPQAAAPPGENGLIDRMPFSWRGPRTGRIPAETTDDAPTPSAAARLPEATRLHYGQSRTGYLEPDATLIAGAPGEQFAMLIEYDRTGRPSKQIDRLRRYDRWLLEGWRHGPFAEHAIAPTVLLIAANDPQVTALAHIPDQTLSAWHGTPHASAAEGTHPGRQRITFSSREQVISDWRVERAPRLPPEKREQRDRSAAHSARSTTFNLVTLL